VFLAFIVFFILFNTLSSVVVGQADVLQRLCAHRKRKR
jgi:hypothetical protein